MQTHSSLDQIEPVSKADTEISFLLSSCYLSQLEALMFLPAALTDHLILTVVCCKAEYHIFSVLFASVCFGRAHRNHI